MGPITACVSSAKCTALQQKSTPAASPPEYACERRAICNCLSLTPPDPPSNVKRRPVRASPCDRARSRGGATRPPERRFSVTAEGLLEGNTCVVGLQWGDEGKGKIVDFLAEKADVV